MNPESPSGTALTFPWGDRPRSLWRLLPYTLICAAALTSLAFIFKSKTPAPTPTHSISQSILLLDPANPINQTVLSHAQDKSLLVLSPDPIDESIARHPLLPVFKPSFSHFQVRLKEPYVSRPPTQQVRLFQPSDLALPPASRTLPKGAPPTAASTRAGAKPWQLVAQFQGPIASRTVRTPPNLTALRPKDLARLRFQIAVKPDGRTLLVLPISSATEDREFLPALQSALSATRFEPKPDSSNEWGQITFAWTIAPNASP